MSELTNLLSAARHWSRCKDVYDKCTKDDLPDPLREYRESIKTLGESLGAYDAAQADAIRWRRIASFWVPGSPQAQPRAKASAFGGHVRMYTPDPKRKDGSKPVGTWRQMLRLHSAGRCPGTPLDCPVKVDIAFYLPRTKMLSRKSSPTNLIPHAVKPDIDNMTKLIYDEMTKAGWWKDDSRICASTVTKSYPAKDSKPGAMITVSVIEQDGCAA